MKPTAKLVELNSVGITHPREYKDMADDYCAIAHPTTFRKLKNDLEAIHQYVETGFRMILNGETGRYEGVRFVEQTNIAKQAWTAGNNSNFAFFFGDDTVAEAIAIPEEMRGRIPTDFGRSRGIAWYYLGKDICPFAAKAANDNCVNSGEAQLAA